MEVFESIGFIHFWGISPPINVLDQKSEDERINILLAGTSDLRHILKTVADNCRSEKPKCLHFYFYETSKELISRLILLLQVLHLSSLSYRERLELFLDIYGNNLYREKTQKYIDQQISDILNLLAEDGKTRTPLKQVFDFSELRYKDRDEIVDSVKSWSSKVPFTMEKHRDQRLRHHYKERYDFRKNLIDWDYQMSVKNAAPIIHFYHYRDWR